jgi:methylmalonyl-CoA mutase
MKVLFDQIPLDEMSVSMTMNGAVYLLWLLLAAEEQGVKPELLSERYKTTLRKSLWCTTLYLSEQL